MLELLWVGVRGATIAYPKQFENLNYIRACEFARVVAYLNHIAKRILYGYLFERFVDSKINLTRDQSSNREAVEVPM